MAKTDTMSYRTGPLAWMLRPLRRFEAGEPATAMPFKQRRARLLQVGSLALLCLSTFWALAYLWIGEPERSLYNVPGVLLALLIRVALALGMQRIASLLVIFAALLTVALVSLFIDVPTAEVPRSVPLYLLPLAALTHFLLQHERWHFRGPFLALQLLLFVALAVNPHDYGQPNLLPDSQRFPASLGTALCAFALLWWVVHVIMSEVRERSRLEVEFARAIAEGQLGFHLQAIHDAQGRVVGAEALMRWHHPRRGMVSPAEFIPMAERSGLIVPASERLLRDVCSLLARWKDDPALAGIAVSVNISAVQFFEDSLPVRLLDRVPAIYAVGDRLKLELTESVFVQDLAQVRSLLQELRSASVRISLDDFGTGFSSLTYLRMLPLDQIKVDRSFVSDLPSDPDALKIAQTIVQLGRDLNLEIVAEGVETEAQRSSLQEMGCQYFQGFLLARPMSIDAFEAHAHTANSRAPLAVQA